MPGNNLVDEPWMELFHRISFELIKHAHKTPPGRGVGQYYLAVTINKRSLCRHFFSL